jgi:hypothetical protein
MTVEDDKFVKHLEWASATVMGWPPWKQSVLGELVINVAQKAYLGLAQDIFASHQKEYEKTWTDVNKDPSSCNCTTHLGEYGIYYTYNRGAHKQKSVGLETYPDYAKLLYSDLSPLAGRSKHGNYYNDYFMNLVDCRDVIYADPLSLQQTRKFLTDHLPCLD